MILGCSSNEHESRQNITDDSNSSFQGGTRPSVSQVSGKLFDENQKLTLPLDFPIKGWKIDVIQSVPESRLPGAPRTYRGANARHEGVDFYTGQCGLEVIAPADGWIIDLTNREMFPDATTRDAILRLTEKARLTPDPILANLHGISLVIFHGWVSDTNFGYCRLSHLDGLSSDFQLGDFVKRGQVVGYVGASGTSAQFKSDIDKVGGCHLHFEWHYVESGVDKPIGIDERDAAKKRKLYSDLFK